MRQFLAVALCAALSGIGAAGAQLPADVVPMADWSEFSTLNYGTGPVVLHLRTGYQRPMIMPEPVSLQDGADGVALSVEVDTEVVIFSPADHFSTQSLRFRGLQSGLDYRVHVSASAFGSRKPVQLER